MPLLVASTETRTSVADAVTQIEPVAQEKIYKKKMLSDRDISACDRCGSVFRFRAMEARCDNCGSHLTHGLTPIDPAVEPKFIGVMGFMKPVADSVMKSMRDGNMLRDDGGKSMQARLDGPVCCGWCGTQLDRRPDSANCTNCGGLLPIPPGGDPGPPPNQKRNLPKGFLYNLYIKQNVGGIMGLGVMLVSIPFMLIPVLGIPAFLFGLLVAYSNWIAARRRHVALVKGQPTLGRLESVLRIGPKEATNHGSVLYYVYFRFNQGDRAFLGLKYTYDPTVSGHFEGQPIWVLVVPGRPKLYALWPPLA